MMVQFFVDGYTSNRVLSESELNCLEQCIWFASNINADLDETKSDAIEKGFPQLLAIILSQYHK